MHARNSMDLAPSRPDSPRNTLLCAGKRHANFLFALAGLLTLCQPNVWGQTLTPIADATVDRAAANQNTNYGTATTLLADSFNPPAAGHHALLKFDISSAPGAITNAKLRLYGSESAFAEDVPVETVSDNSWTETGVTWANEPGFGWYADLTIGTTLQYYEWNVTGNIQQIQMAGLNLASFMLGAVPGASIATFNSREAATNRPQLVLTTSGAAPSYTISATAPAHPISRAGSSTSQVTVTVAPVNGFNGNVTFTAAGLPTGVTASFSPATTKTVSTLSFIAGANAPPTNGSVTVTITGTAGSLVRTTTVSVSLLPIGPASISATVLSSTSIAVNWSAVSVPTMPTNYYVGWYQVGVTGSDLSVPGTSHTFTGLLPGTQYEYFAAAQYAVGSFSDWSLPVYVTTFLPAPGSVSATLTASNTITVSWAAVAGAQSYKVMRGASTGNETTLVGQPSAPATSFSDTTGTSGTTYYYVVYAVDSSGASGDKSAEASALDVAAPVVTGPTTASGTTGVAFSTQIVATNSPASYGATGLPAGLSVATSTGLISGTPAAAGTFSATIQATNAGGTGSAGLTITIAAVMPAITSPTTANGILGSAFSYQITASNIPTGFNASNLPSGLSVNTSTGLISGTPTFVGVSSGTIAASNLAGSATATLTITIAPPTPQNLRASANSTSSANLNWDAVPSGSFSVVYNVYVGTSSGGETLNTSNVSTNSLLASGLNANTTYYFTVKSVINGVTSASSNEASTKTLPPPPPPPASVTAVAGVNPLRVDVSWTASTGVGPITYYIYRWLVGGGSPTLLTTTSNLTYTDTTVAEGSTYGYEVKASNTGGSSATYSDSVTTSILPPANVSALGNTTSTVGVSWSSSAVATSYNILRSTTNGGQYTFIQSVTAPTTNYSDIGLSPGTTYYYVIQAATSTQTSANSSQAMGGTVCLPPNGFAVAQPTPGVKSTSITFSGSSGAANYNIYRTAYFNNIYQGALGIGPVTPAPTVTPKIDSNGLAYYYNYVYYATAVNSQGIESAPSNSSSLVVLPNILITFTPPQYNSSVDLTISNTMAGWYANTLWVWSPPSIQTLVNSAHFRASIVGPSGGTACTIVEFNNQALSTNWFGVGGGSNGLSASNQEYLGHFTNQYPDPQQNPPTYSLGVNNNSGVTVTFKQYELEFYYDPAF